MLESKRSESMTSADTSNYTTEAVRRHCTNTMKKYLERKPAHPRDVLSKNSDTFWKKNPKQLGRVHE